MMRWIAIVTAGTWVHTGHKHQRTGKLYVVFGTADSYLPVFQRLPKYLQSMLVKLGKFIAEEHAIVCQSDFTRHGVDSSSDKSHLGNRVMWRAERTLTDERSATSQLACNAV